MSLPFDTTAPAIEPVPAGTSRPLWSVMIPTFNCASYLRQTLASVLAQDPGADQMQIEVVDDCSTKDDPEAVVREVGQGRVAFYRQPKNGGVNANFNTCLARSRGTLVHILHGDDYVLPGFYARLGTAATANPELALYACRSFFVDETNVIGNVTERLWMLEAGARDVSSFYYSTALQTPSVVVRRFFYEKHGGFLPALPHTGDREMWTRAIGTGGGLVVPEVLACYRMFSTNDTGRLARTAGNLRDLDRLNALFAKRYPGFDPQKAMRHLRRMALEQMEVFNLKGDAEAAQANWNYWKEKTPFSLRLRRQAGKIARRFLS